MPGGDDQSGLLQHLPGQTDQQRLAGVDDPTWRRPLHRPIAPTVAYEHQPVAMTDESTTHQPTSHQFSVPLAGGMSRTLRAASVTTLEVADPELDHQEERFLDDATRHLRHAVDAVATQFGEVARTMEPESVRLVWLDSKEVFDGAHMPVMLGRSRQANFRVDDGRVSRSHARLDWQGGAFQLTDLSYNGTYVRFGNAVETITLRRRQCTLHGSGWIGLGGSPSDPTAPSIRFELLSFGDTLPMRP